MGETVQTPAAPLPDTDPLPCPHCGYDLRASTADQCSECGHAIDRATLGVSGFPWSARHNIRNYLKTVWLVTINSRRLRFETSKNQNLAHARSFQRITTFIVALTLAATCAVIVTADSVIFAISRGTPKSATWRDDLLVAWAAGATLRPVIPTMFLLLGIHLTRVHHPLFRLKSASAHLQDRASAIACYTTAPLAWLLPLAIVAGAIFGLIISGGVDVRSPLLWFSIFPWLPIPPVLALLLVPLTLLRILQWTLRVRNRGAEYSLLIVPHLLGLWLLGFVFYLGFLPWCIGLIWIAIDSFR